MKKKLKTKRKKGRPVTGNQGEKDGEEVNGQEEEEEGDGHEGEQENSVHRERASSALIPPRKSKPKRKTRVKEETLDGPQSPDSDEKALKG